MKHLVQIYIFFVVIVFLQACQTDSQPKDKSSETLKAGDYEMVWSDEFDYEGLPDTTKWTYDTEGNEAGWGNNEAQFYTDSRLENARVENGLLKIIARKENWGDKEYTSARLISRSAWKHGRIEVSAKLPSGVGTWSAIWMMPEDWSFHDGNWPDIGEIDIMEHVGHDIGIVHASAHSKEYQWWKGTQKTATVKVGKTTESFNTYALEWTEDALKALVNDSIYFVYENEGLGEDRWPYTKPFYLILNIAVGGEWGRVKGIDDESFPQTMEVDYVRIYKKK